MTGSGAEPDRGSFTGVLKTVRRVFFEMGIIFFGVWAAFWSIDVARAAWQADHDRGAQVPPFFVRMLGSETGSTWPA